MVECRACIHSGVRLDACLDFDLLARAYDAVRLAERFHKRCLGSFELDCRSCSEIAVSDKEYIPVSFRIALSSNGDIEIFYDDYDPNTVFQSGSTMF